MPKRPTFQGNAFDKVGAKSGNGIATHGTEVAMGGSGMKETHD
ncbi:hypothetical protein [Vibrio sp. SCSIO 43137]|nr:hypothetical protein [Vibrio sp. SCSIO 43137]WCE28801.1 hypothetical protein PK654_10565 [Vibrio sp. SCSIO 43137]